MFPGKELVQQEILRYLNRGILCRSIKLGAIKVCLLNTLFYENGRVCPDLPTGVSKVYLKSSEHNFLLLGNSFQQLKYYSSKNLLKV